MWSAVLSRRCADEQNRRIGQRALPITTQASADRGTDSDASTRKWDARAAAEVDSGFKVLLEGTNDRYRDQYIVWSTDFNGTINNSTGWTSGDKLEKQGMETLFGVDLNADELI